MKWKFSCLKCIFIHDIGNIIASVQGYYVYTDQPDLARTNPIYTKKENLRNSDPVEFRTFDHISDIWARVRKRDRGRGLPSPLTFSTRAQISLIFQDSYHVFCLSCNKILHLSVQNKLIPTDLGTSLQLKLWRHGVNIAVYVTSQSFWNVGIHARGFIRAVTG